MIKMHNIYPCSEHNIYFQGRIRVWIIYALELQPTKSSNAAEGGGEVGHLVNLRVALQQHTIRLLRVRLYL